VPNVVINTITNANIYIDGNNLIGRAEEVKLPEVEAEMVEQKRVGMMGKISLPTGINALEAEIKWGAIYADVARMISNIYQTHEIQVRANIETYSSQGRVAEVPLVCYITGLFKKFPLGTFKQLEQVDLPSSLQVYYLKQVVDGVEIVEFDSFANIYKVAGVDVAATYRLNVGA